MTLRERFLGIILLLAISLSSTAQSELMVFDGENGEQTVFSTSFETFNDNFDGGQSVITPMSLAFSSSNGSTVAKFQDTTYYHPLGFDGYTGFGFDLRYDGGVVDLYQSPIIEFWYKGPPIFFKLVQQNNIEGSKWISGEQFYSLDGQYFTVDLTSLQPERWGDPGPLDLAQVVGFQWQHTGMDGQISQMYIDDIRLLGDSRANPFYLDTKISEAQLLLGTIVEGDENGMYPYGTYQYLEENIYAATDVLNNFFSLIDHYNAELNLHNAIDSVENSQITVSLLIDDCNDGDGVNLQGGLWYSSTDIGIGGSSTITPESNNFIMNGDGIAQNDFSAHVSYFLDGSVNIGFNPFVAFGTDLSNSRREFNISSATGISFWHKGDSCRFNLVSAHILDADYYEYNVPASADWQLIEFEWAEMAQQGWGDPMDFRLSQVTGFSWEISGPDGTSGDIWIDDIRIEGLAYKQILQDEVQLAQTLLGSLNIGNQIGQYPAQAYTDLQSSIVEANTVLASNATLQMVYNTVDRLILAQNYANTRVNDGAALVDNCSDGNGQNLFGGYWSTLNDYEIGGNSFVEPLSTENNNFYMDAAGVDPNGLSAHITYSLYGEQELEFYPFVIMRTNFDHSFRSIDISSASGISFWHKGDSCRLNILTNNILDWDYYGVSIEQSDIWQYIELNWSDFQQDGWGITMPMDLSQASALEWYIKGPDGTAGDIWIDDIKIEGFDYKTILLNLINTATATIEGITVGSAIGEYPQEAKINFENVIAEAQLIADDQTSSYITIDSIYRVLDLAQNYFLTTVNDESTLIDNCDDMDNINMLGGYWFSNDDSELGGLSYIEPLPEDQFVMIGMGVNDLGHSAKANFDLYDNGAFTHDPFVMYGTDFTTYQATIDQTLATGVSFWHKGSSCNINLNAMGIDDTDFYQYTIHENAEWQYYELTWSQFAQEGWGISVPFEQTDILGIFMEIQAPTGTSGAVWIDDLKIEGFSAGNAVALRLLTEDAHVLLTNASVGDGQGQYPVQQYSTLYTAHNLSEQLTTQVLVSQTDIDNQYAVLENAIIDFNASLIVVDTTLLADEIISATDIYNNSEEGTASGQYPAGSKVTLLAAIDSADIVLNIDTVSQSEVDAALAYLQAAESTFLSSVIGVSTTALQVLIQETQAIHDNSEAGDGNGQYPLAAFADLQFAIDSAQEVLVLDPVTQQEINDAVAYLQDAQSVFLSNIITVDVSDLQLAIQDAMTVLDTTVVGDGNGQYTMEAATQLQLAIDSAQLVSEIDTISLVEMNEMITYLNDASTSYLVSEIAVDFYVYDSVVQSVQAVHDAAVEGDGNGQYPEGAKAELEAAIVWGHIVAGNDTVSQAELNAVIADLQTAQAAFEAQQIVVDYSALETLIQDVRQVQELAVQGDGNGQYTADAKLQLQAAIDSAQAIAVIDTLNNLEIEQTEIYLNNARADFLASVLVVDYTALQSLIIEVQAIHDNATEGIANGQYPAGSKATLQSAIDAASDVAVLDTASQLEVNDAIADLQQAEDDFLTSVIGVNYTPLQVLIQDAQSIHDAAQEGAANGQYLTGSKAELQTAIDSATVVLNNETATQEQINMSVEELHIAIDIFESSIVTIDLTVLEVTIVQAQSLYETSIEGDADGQYIVGSKAILLDAITTAETVLNNPAVTQTAVSIAILDLEAAIEDFSNSIVTVNVSALTSLITTAQSIHDGSNEGEGQGQYPVGSKAELQTAIDSATIVLNDPLSSQEDITNSVAYLNEQLDLFQTLVNGVSYTELQVMYNDAVAVFENTDEGNAEGQYPSDSRSIFATEIQYANEVLNNMSATQEEINVASETLSIAILNYQESVVHIQLDNIYPTIFEAENVLANIDSTVDVGYNVGQYTPEAYSNLLESLGSAHDVINDPLSWQEDVDLAADVLAIATEEFIASLNVTPVAVRGITLPNSIGLVVGTSEMIYPTIIPANATNTRVVWNSLNPAIATIENGNIHAIARGMAYVSATTVDGQFTAYCQVYVNEAEVPIESISLPTNILVQVNDNVSLVADIEPSNSTDQSIIWTSSNNAVATVSSNGVVRGLQRGSVQITATSFANPTLSSTCLVQVANSAAPVAISNSVVTMHTSQTATIDLRNYVSDDSTSFDNLDIYQIRSNALLISPISDGEITVFVNTSDWTGLDTITMVVEDEDGLTLDLSIIVEVSGAENQAPVVNVPPVSLSAGETREFPIRNYITDDYTAIEDIVLFFINNENINIESQSGNIVLSVIDESWYGVDTMQIIAIDADQARDTADFIVSVIAQDNQAPVLSPIADQVIDGQLAFNNIDLTQYVTDDYTMPHEIVWSVSASSRINMSIESSVLSAAISDYYWSGTESVTLFATDNEGLSDSIIITFTQQTSIYTDWGDVPSVTVSASAQLVSPGVPVQFIAQINGAISQEWIFEGLDVEPSSSFIEEVVFDRSGTYTVTLSATNQHGTTEEQITVVVFGFDQTDTTICAGGSVDVNIDPALITQWEWADGSTSLNRTFTPQNDTSILAYGLYMGELFSDTLHIAIAPQVELDDTIRICDGESANIIVSLEGAYEWSTGSVNDTITVSEAGTYSVDYTYNNMCTSTDAVVLVVNQLPEAALADTVRECQGTDVVLSAAAGSSFVWSTQEETSEITVSEAGLYSVTITDNNGCINIDSTQVVYREPFAEQLGVATAAYEGVNQIALAWNKTAGMHIEKYIVKKQEITSDNFVVIDEVDFDEPSLVIDNDADVSTKSYTYKLITVDSLCAYEAESDAHTTMHVTSSLGTNPGDANLHWNHYIGVDYVGYRIYKWENGDTVLIAQHPKSANPSESYTYHNHVAGMQYRVGIVLPVVIDENSALKTESGPYSQALSNIVEMEITGLKDNSSDVNVTVYPNPVSDIISVSTGDVFAGTVVVDLVAPAGEIIDSKTIANGVIDCQFDVSDLAKGVYQIRINSDAGTTTQSVIVE